LALNPYGGVVNVPTSTPSTLTTNGALVVTGGVGVGGAVNVGGNSNSLGFVLNRTNNSGHYTGTSDNYGFTWTGTNGEMSTATGSMIFKPANTTALTLTSTAATFAGAVSLSTAGTTVSIKSGTNAAAGTVTLTGGAGTITSTAIDVNTVIVMTIKTKSGSFDHAPSVVVAAGSATIDGHNSDASTYNWAALKVD
jgi:hypothetical protein